MKLSEATYFQFNTAVKVQRVYTSSLCTKMTEYCAMPRKTAFSVERHLWTPARASTVTSTVYDAYGQDIMAAAPLLSVDGIAFLAPSDRGRRCTL